MHAETHPEFVPPEVLSLLPYVDEETITSVTDALHSRSWLRHVGILGYLQGKYEGADGASSVRTVYGDLYMALRMHILEHDHPNYPGESFSSDIDYHFSEISLND